jgi:hypothetical protein
MWSLSSSVSKVDRPLCCVILKSGVKKGSKCGKSCSAGKDTCSAHSKTAAATPTPVSVLRSTPAMFHKSSFGNFVCDGFILNRVLKVIIGKEASDGSTLPLTADDMVKVRALGLVPATEKAVSPIVRVRKEVELEEVEDEDEEVEDEEVEDEEPEDVEEDMSAVENDDSEEIQL